MVHTVRQALIYVLYMNNSYTLTDLGATVCHSHFTYEKTEA